MEDSPFPPIDSGCSLFAAEPHCHCRNEQCLVGGSLSKMSSFFFPEAPRRTLKLMPRAFAIDIATLLISLSSYYLSLQSHRSRKSLPMYYCRMCCFSLYSMGHERATYSFLLVMLSLDIISHVIATSGK